MKRSLGRWWCVALSLAALGASACAGSCGGSNMTSTSTSTASSTSSSSGTTNFELTLHGGFGYVVNPDFTVEAGFMKDIDEGAGGCQVKQLGVVLRIDDGQITSSTINPTLPAPMSYEVADYKIDFGGFGATAVDLNSVLKSSLQGTNTSTPPAAAAANGPTGERPVPRKTDADWYDLFWVPHTRLNFWEKDIDPEWRTNAVTGRVVLSGGVLAAGMPSDPVAVNGTWEFRSINGARAQKHAITDRLRFQRTVSGASITINLTRGGTTDQIVVAPIDSRKTVGLIVTGRHASPMPVGFNQPIEHFCTYYQLIKKSKRPPQKDRLLPYWVGSGTPGVGAASTTGQASPGAFCPGDWP